MTSPKKPVIVVGAGMAGLTAAAYLLQGGQEVLVLEKTSQCGGLVSSFNKEGFHFDTGPRAMGNAGILVPMLEDLGINLPMIPGLVSLGIGDSIVHFDTREGNNQFLQVLDSLFPHSTPEIKKIGTRIRSYTKLARILNNMPNPFFRNVFRDWKGFLTQFIPRMPGFLAAVVKMSLRAQPMEETLAALSRNRSLTDMVSQHFFKGTPATFALGYFENFQDYLYPLGGTAQLPAALVKYIQAQGGTIKTSTEILGINPATRTLIDQNEAVYTYDQLLWCGDLNSLYSRVQIGGLSPKIQGAILKEQEKYAQCPAGESVFTLFLGVDEPPEVFGKISRGHFIYTPRSEGLGELHRSGLDRLKENIPRLTLEEVFSWIKDFCDYNSFEISIPVLKDPSLAPPGKTGLVISLLMDGELFQLIRKAGWYKEFKNEMARTMIQVLERTLYPNLGKKILFQETASPLTLRDRFNTTGGAITGWSMESPVPVPHSLLTIMTAPKTAIPGVWKAGQWTYSPAGVPIAVLTGRVAASAIQDSRI